MSKQREALKRAFIALYHMLIDFDISPGVAIDPPKRYPLNDEQIDALELPPNGCTMRELVRAIERAHGIGGEA